jgi:tRNA A-37 threonylcarbamoyl transferase component Bud32
MSISLDGTVQEHFVSRKNNVVKIVKDGNTHVVKVFVGERLPLSQKEYDMLVACTSRGLSVPTPLRISDGMVMMSFVDGVNAGDVFDSISSGSSPNWSESKEALSLVNGLSSWLASFHRAFEWKTRRGDSILRNFIVSSGRVYGIDFEESRPGDPLADLGEACAWALSTDPMFTSQKLDFARNLVSSYSRFCGQDVSKSVPNMVADALEYYARFRRDNSEMRSRARVIRSRGL